MILLKIQQVKKDARDSNFDIDLIILIDYFEVSLDRKIEWNFGKNMDPRDEDPRKENVDTRCLC